MCVFLDKSFSQQFFSSTFYLKTADSVSREYLLYIQK